MLTRKQSELLKFIHTRIAGGDIAPSFDEMRDALGLKSKSGVHRLINALVERGYLERLPNRARALEIKKLPDHFEAPETIRNQQASQEDKIVSFPASNASTYDVPLYGKIAAGSPIEAIRDEEGRVDLPSSLMGRGECYALTIDGDSMIEAGIHNGDTVLIERTEQARNGDIVVALVDGEEVTLKHFRKEGSKIHLIPANRHYKTMIYNADQVQIQGRLSGLLRTYH